MLQIKEYILFNNKIIKTDNENRENKNYNKCKLNNQVNINLYKVKKI